MSTAFNPYAEWLGLPAELTSPNHYALLGLPLLEADPAKVATAADRAMSKVRACKPGAHAPAWAQLLDDISAAKNCLTNPEQKSAYDELLRTGQTPAAAAPTVSNPAAANPNMYPPGSPQAPMDGTQVAPQAPLPAGNAAAVPAPTGYQQPAAALPNPMDPMAPMAVPGPAAPMAPMPQPVAAAPTYPQALPTPVAPVPQPIPGAPTGLPGQPVAMPQATPVGLPGQPVNPVPSAMPQAAPAAMPAPVQPVPVQAVPVQAVPVQAMPVQAMPVQAVPVQAMPAQAMPVQAAPVQAAPVQAAPVQAAPVVQQPASPRPQAAAAASVAATQPDVRGKRSATAMAVQRSGGGVMLPILIGGGVGMVVLLVVGVAFYLGKSEPEVYEEQVAVVDPSEPPPVLKRVDKSELPQAPVAQEIPTTPEPESTPAPSPPPMEMTTQTPGSEMEPTPDPSMSEEPADTGPTREELRRLAEALTAARTAIGKQDFALVDAELAKAEELVKAEDHQAKLRRLTLLADYVKKFREAIDRTIEGFDVGDQVPYNETVSFGIVEIGPNLLNVRVSGENRPYRLNELPPGLARRLGEMSLAKGTPETLAMQAAFISVMPKINDAELAKAREWWEQASSVPDVPDLVTAINDDYSLREDLANVPLNPDAMDELSGFMERLKDARTLKEFAAEYQSAIDEGIEKLEPEMELEIGRSTIVTIDEVLRDRIVVRVADLKRGFQRSDLPLGFAVAVADQTIPRDVPLAMVMKGAYYAERDRRHPQKQFREQVLAWWQAAGEANQDLQPVVAELAKQYPE